MRADNDQSEVRIATVSPPASEPVTLAELKLHCRVDISEDNDLLTALIQVAREWVEAHTARRLIMRTETLFLDGFPKCDRIVIPVAPLQAIGAITYLDDTGASSTVDSSTYVTDINGPLGIVALKTGQSWPSLSSARRPVNAVRVGFTSGYASVDAVPASLKHAVKLFAAHLYENREVTAPIDIKTVPFGILALLRPFRIPEALA